MRSASRDDDLLGQLRHIAPDCPGVQPLNLVRDTATRLLRVHALRSADALQLAAALIACDHRPQGWQFVCLDMRLSAAAEREGFKVLREV